MKGNAQGNRRGGGLEKNTEILAELNKMNSTLEKIAEMEKKIRLLDSFVGEITVYVPCSSLTPRICQLFQRSWHCFVSQDRVAFLLLLLHYGLGRFSYFRKSSKPPGLSFQ